MQFGVTKWTQFDFWSSWVPTHPSMGLGWTTLGVPWTLPASTSTGKSWTSSTEVTEGAEPEVPEVCPESVSTKTKWSLV